MSNFCIFVLLIFRDLTHLFIWYITLIMYIQIRPCVMQLFCHAVTIAMLIVWLYNRKWWWISPVLGSVNRSLHEIYYHGNWLLRKHVYQICRLESSSRCQPCCHSNVINLWSLCFYTNQNFRINELNFIVILIMRIICKEQCYIYWTQL